MCSIETDGEARKHHFLILFIEATMQWMLNHFISFDFINLYNNLLKETYCLSWVVEETETE